MLGCWAVIQRPGTGAWLNTHTLSSLMNLPLILCFLEMYMHRNVLNLMLEILGCVFRKNFSQSNSHFESDGNNPLKWN